MTTMIDELRKAMHMSGDIDVYDKKQIPCVLISGKTKMTWNSFASACLARQANSTVIDSLCQICPVGQHVKLGHRVDPPQDLTIIEPDGWTERPIKYPADRVFKATKYAFRTMELGNTVEHPLIDKKQFLNARAHLKRRYGMWFDFETVNNTMIIRRIK